MTNTEPVPETDTSAKLSKFKDLGHQAHRVIKPLQSQVMPQVRRFSHALNEQYRKIDLKHEPKQRRFFVATVTLFIVWMLLVGTLTWSEIGVGLMVAALTAWLSSNHLAFTDHIKFSPTMPLHILRYLHVFLVALVRANIDMARRVLSPRLPINPVLVEVETQLHSSLGKLMLANSITLTPGTLTIDVVENRLQVHWVDSTPGEDLESATHAIAESFERHLREFLE